MKGKRSVHYYLPEGYCPEWFYRWEERTPEIGDEKYFRGEWFVIKYTEKDQYFESDLPAYVALLKRKE